MSLFYTLLLILLVVDGLVLTLVVLMQAGKGGGLAAMGGGSAATEGILAGRQAATVFTRASWICGGVFMALALVLSIMSSRAQQPASILEEDFRQAPAGTPQPVVPGGAAPTQPGTPEPAPTTPQQTPPAGR
jgi:preprotein translocase subunit SecG